MTRAALKAAWLAEEARAFSGWDFSALAGRWHSPALPWDYIGTARRYLKPTDRLLDMGTGGGECLLQIGHPYKQTAVTEGWAPNVALCKEKLAPLGVEVREIFDADAVPYPDAQFDVVLNRNEDFDVGEVARVLKSGGFFVTQQVGGQNNADLAEKVIGGYAPSFPGHNLGSNLKKIRAGGFRILHSEDCTYTTTYDDIGAVVYAAKILQWEFPGFSVERCFDNLCALQRTLEEKGKICATENRFLIVAQKA